MAVNSMWSPGVSTATADSAVILRGCQKRWVSPADDEIGAR
jgi:hypothetical protein